ncbi:M13 family metallopeptidase [Hoyosella subflava]|uniref:Metalloendopeptidase PepO n=1 Tax=Hoyosella subflava (strain DSM 45089 / JCM 17490 / NBRC 109087 / DQS3-9A1) TaxID=443218 RepID=F6EK63_HOYSD|nr:M13 family metallopeptidase [Hoyosella subflava]AEF42604.1 Metalloendopeptidase PepO [Hoyosella subflava DQS3-9A1]
MSSTAKSGIDLAHRDVETRPQDDLFEHVNGKWLAEHEIPADRALDGAFRKIFDEAEENVRTIIEEAAASHADAGSDAQLIGDLYASFMESDRVNALGLTPLQDELTAVAAAADLDELGRLMGELQRAGTGGAISYYIYTDAKKSDRYLVHLSQSGIGLPDESYYRDERHADVRDKYVAHIERMFALCDTDRNAADVFELERQLASGHWDVVKRRDAELSYNLLTLDELRELAPSFPWQAWIAGLHATDTQFAEVVVRQPEFLRTLGELWPAVPLETWKSWMMWRVINTRAPYLTDEIVETNFDFHGRTLSGAEVLRDRWKRGVSLVEHLLGEAVGKLYVDRHFPPAAKSRMEQLVDNLIEAYRQSISTLEWMSPETRKAALGKLEKFTPKIGYPEEWKDYSSIVIERADLYGNVRRGSAAEHDREFAKLGGPVDRGEWFMTPQTVNAYYNPGMNEIVFPAAILQPPFFDPDADDAANYGGIGAVIGHEIGHGFDDQGSKYDGDGNLVNWWTDQDREEFGKRTAKLIAQYSEFEPKALPGKKVNGDFTIGENIGDLGGLAIALRAYKIATNGSDAPTLDGLSGLQRVFFGWAQVWRAKVRNEEAERRLATDPHSPPEFRCNGVLRNIDDFYDAFDVTEADGLFLEESERVKIW